MEEKGKGEKDKPQLDPITDDRANTSSASNVSQSANTTAAETSLQPTTHTVAAEEVFSEITLTASNIISVLQQQLLNTQKELDKAYGLVDLLLLENQKLRDATTEFYEYAKVEFQKSHLVSEPPLEAQSLKKSSRHKDQTRQESVPRGKLPKQLAQGPNLSVPKSVSTSSECPICSNIEHELLNCPKFKTLETNERLEIATSSRSCFHCLRRGHRLIQCRNDKRRLCGVNGCQKYEHPLIHCDLETKSKHKNAKV
jgi:hypothetical protein